MPGSGRRLDWRGLAWGLLVKPSLFLARSSLSSWLSSPYRILCDFFLLILFLAQSSFFFFFLLLYFSREILPSLLFLSLTHDIPLSHFLTFLFFSFLVLCPPRGIRNVSIYLLTVKPDAVLYALITHSRESRCGVEDWGWGGGGCGHGDRHYMNCFRAIHRSPSWAGTGLLTRRQPGCKTLC